MSRLSRRAILFAGALMSLPLSAYSAGLGKLTVLSNLGEPLKAEIEVVAVEKGERDSLSARLAAVEAYLQANLPFPSGSWGLKVALDTRPNGEPYVSISSVNPVSEPFVDVLVDLRWNGGRLLRAYTALLDPPAYAALDTVSPATPAPVAQAPQRAVEAAPLDQPATTAPLADPESAPTTELNAANEALQEDSQPEPASAADEPAPVAKENPVEAAKPTPAPAPNASTDRVPPRVVKRGETLSKIAREVKPADVSLEQMLVVLYRTNPDAFAGNNMNRLKTGKILRVPEASELADVSLGEAIKEVRVQAADWNAWREKIAGGVDSTPAISETSQSAAGAITAKVEEKPADAGVQPKEVLKLSKGEAKGDNVAGSAGGKGDAKGRVQALEEEVAARSKAVSEATERSLKLEKTIKDMQALMEMKNKDMADVQQAATQAAKPDAKAAPSAAPAAEVKHPDAAAKPEMPAKGEPMEAAESKPAATPDATIPSATTGDPTVQAPATPTTPAPQAVTAPTLKKPVRVAPPEEPSLVAKILGEPLYLAGGAGLLALLGLGGFVAWRKRKAGAEDADDSDIAEDTQDRMPPMTEEALADTLADNMSATAAAAQAGDDHVTDEADAVAEAEVYMAYGRDAQAEQILKDALETQPSRQEIYTKLLEIYHKRKDVAAFGPVAQALHDISRGTGNNWQKAARMGFQIDPSNGLYADGAGAAPMDSDTAASGSFDNKLDLDLGLGQGEAGTNTDIDLGDMTLNADHTDLDLDGLAGSTDSADLDLRTQVLDNTRQMDLGKTVEATAKTQQMRKMGMTTEMSRTQEGRSATKESSLDFDLDLSTITGATSSAKAEPGGLDFDVGKLSLDATMDGKSEPKLGLTGATLPDVDLSSISLDLDGSGSAGTNGSKDEHWHDVQTKFDLAKAYQEMGDKEGAREILREVVQEGDDDQKNAAQKVLEALV